MRAFLSFLALSSLLAAGVLAQAIPQAIPVAQPVTQTVATLRVGDSLDMRLSGMPTEYAMEFNIQYSVGPDGTLNIPLIGEVKALGLTSTQLERTVQNRLIAEKIFTRPTVIVNIAQQARYVSVSGGVRAPQRLAWSPDLTLSTAIGNCGGMGDFSNGKNIRITREAKIVGLYNWKDILKDPAADPKLFPGDQVYVPD